MLVPRHAQSGETAPFVVAVLGGKAVVIGIPDGFAGQNLGLPAAADTMSELHTLVHLETLSSHSGNPSRAGSSSSSRLEHGLKEPLQKHTLSSAPSTPEAPRFCARTTGSHDSNEDFTIEPRAPNSDTAARATPLIRVVSIATEAGAKS